MLIVFLSSQIYTHCRCSLEIMIVLSNKLSIAQHKCKSDLAFATQSRVFFAALAQGETRTLIDNTRKTGLVIIRVTQNVATY